ncbi:hypothetical protein L227DRAFT_429875 [Lentinus tigrinus ALCF2SS1-6]|uniref:Uncharacterized protein n=1 Tax=Lentinus tigrinus ALCF2SS1-6 TaxID=1328759 RepID=A0A5C2SH69_9APHY|nr:hypothetical protein L227DRAFT_429875 [Lentinus tigrinus ALCF2SS1-6]
MCLYTNRICCPGLRSAFCRTSTRLCAANTYAKCGRVAAGRQEKPAHAVHSRAGDNSLLASGDRLRGRGRGSSQSHPEPQQMRIPFVTYGRSGPRPMRALHSTRLIAPHGPRLCPPPLLVAQAAHLPPRPPRQARPRSPSRARRPTSRTLRAISAAIDCVDYLPRPPTASRAVQVPGRMSPTNGRRRPREFARPIRIRPAEALCPASSRGGGDAFVLGQITGAHLSTTSCNSHPADASERPLRRIPPQSRMTQRETMTLCASDVAGRDKLSDLCLPIQKSFACSAVGVRMTNVRLQIDLTLTPRT